MAANGLTGVKAHLVEPNDLGWILGPTWGRRELTSTLWPPHPGQSYICNLLPQTHTNKCDTFF